jgi:hypothetical protein
MAAPQSRRRPSGSALTEVGRRNHDLMGEAVIAKRDRHLLSDANQPQFVDVPDFADRIHGDGHDGGLGIVLNRLVHCAALKREPGNRSLPIIRAGRAAFCPTADAAWDGTYR